MSNELTENAQRPEYLTQEMLDTVDNSDLNAYAKPARIKIVQGQTGPPIKPPHREGDIVITPQLVKIGDNDEPFTFVPIHFFPSWSCLNPIQMRGTLPTIREFSMDPKSPVAVKAKAFTKERCPENSEYFLKYSESLNFMIIVEDVEDFGDVPVHLMFVRGEYGTGQKLIGSLQLRKAPRYACRFRAVSENHSDNKGNNWQGLAIMNDPQPWVEQNDFHRYEKFYKDLKELIDSRTMELDLSDNSEPASEADSEF